MGRSADMETNLASADFVRELQRALHRLYDPGELCKSPLVRLLGGDRREDPMASLRRLLLEAILALKPDNSVPPQADAWRTYHILSQRYVEQYSQGEIAAALALSVRQLRRQQSAALRSLADYLWVRHNLHREGDGSPSAQTRLEGASQSDDTRSLQQELEYLGRSVPSEVTDVGELLRAVAQTALPLLKKEGVQLSLTVPEGLPSVTVQQPMVRQAVLNVLAVAARCTPGGRVSIEARAGQRDVHLLMSPHAALGNVMAFSEEDAESHAMARQLVQLSGGSLGLLPGNGKEIPCTVELVLPATEQISVLVIDDNADTLELMQRYLAGTRYRFLSVPDPKRALTVAAGAAPDVILLDVMLPGIDGWELLGRLREHPRIYGVPIIVCTILPQERLALALGAAAFLRKPVTRPALLAELDRQSAASATGCG